MKIRHQDCTPK